MAYALITGATRGIGKAIAGDLAARKFNLLLAARSEQLLKDASKELTDKYNIKCACLVVDLSELYAPDKVSEWIKKNNYDVSVLINNAGYGLWGRFDAADLTEQLNMMQLNMQTMTKLTYLMLPVLKKQPRAYILNVASTAAYQAVPTLTVYAASKSFIVSFSRGLRQELSESSVSVSCLSPGATETNFMDRARMEALKAKAAKFNMQPKDVARIAMKGMFSGKAEIIPGFINRFSVMMTYFIPKKLTEKIARGIYKLNK